MRYRLAARGTTTTTLVWKWLPAALISQPTITAGYDLCRCGACTARMDNRDRWRCVKGHFLKLRGRLR